MHYPGTMRLVQRVCDLRPVLQHLLERQRSFLQTLRQRFSLHTLHHQILDPILMTDVIEYADVWMIQTGDGLGFTLEALLADAVRRKMRGENLDGNGTFQARVACPIHLAHPARTKRRLDFVGPKSST